MPEITEGTTEIKVRRYISGQWVEGWAASGEVCGTVVTPMSLIPPPQCTPQPCAKSKLIDTARELKWTAEEVVKVLKSMG